MSATVLTAETFDQNIGQGVTLVDFWAPWCGPCKVQLPIVEELSGELNGMARIAKVNVDEQSELAARYKISSIPTLLLFKDGNLIESLIGLRSKEELKNKIANAVSSGEEASCGCGCSH